MRNILKNNKRFLFLSLVISFCVSSSVFSQALPRDLNNLNDEEIYDYYNKAKAQGYTLAQIKAIAMAKGVSSSRIAEMEQKLSGLKGKEDTSGVEQIDNALEIVKEGSSSIALSKEPKDPLFGYDFFNNTNITFTPNVNLATPTNYQLGPGDDLVINVWGAAENTYNMSVDREGAIRIRGVGPIYINGLSIIEATKKIKGALAKIYAGINDRDTSTYKVFIGVSLSNVRTVQVDIIGEVKVPGTYSLNALSSVLNALYASGGPTRKGTFRDIKLVRSGVDIATFDVYKYLLEGSQQGNKNLKDGDVIIVSPYISRIQVAGAIKRPGIYEVKSDETFGNLIDFMSGFSSNAYKDRLLLERIDGDRKKVKEILLDDTINEPLKDGDKIIVNTIIDKYVNRVQIEGAVYRPGVYELTDGLTLVDLITKAAGIREVAFVDRGLLFSTTDGVNKNVTPFSVSDIVSGNENIILKTNDIVKIFNKYNLEESNYITVGGAVNEPGRFNYMANMTIEDLILLGGGLRQEANANLVDVYRKISDDKVETLTESFKVSADGRLSFENGGDFLLEPNDRVSIRFLKGHNDELNVTIVGEVDYPGAYSMEIRDMKISDLIQKSGGVSPYAFVEGGSLIRMNSSYEEKSQNLIIDAIDGTTISEASGLDLNDNSAYRVGINLKAILADKDSKHNLVLKDGDILDIPSIKQTVKVEGDVLAPSLIRFEKGATLKDYINKAGGFGFNAKKSKTFVVYANGDIAATKKFLFFRSFPKLEPGAIVLVPTKVESKRNKMSVTEIVALTTSVASMALLIQTLAN